MAQSYSKQIKDAGSLEEILAVIEKLEDSSLQEAKKETLLVDAHAKKNGIEEAMRTKGEEPPIDKEEKGREKTKKKEEKQAKAASVKASSGAAAEPATKTVEVNVDELKAYEKSGRLYGCEPKGKGNFLAKVLLSLVLAVFMAGNAFAVKEATLGRMGSDGNYRWEVQTGDLVPGTDDTYDIGSSSKAVAEVYVEDLIIETFITFTPISINELPATGMSATTDAAKIYLINDGTDAMDCTVGGGASRNLCISTVQESGGWVSLYRA